MVAMTESLVNDEGSVLNRVEENVIAEEDEMMTNVAALTSSFDSYIDDDIERNGRLESGEEMQIKTVYKKKITFATDTMELAVETSNSCPILFNVDVMQEGYSGDIEGNGILESRDELQIPMAEEEKITFATTGKELAVETSNSCPIVSNDGCKRMVYSISELEALRSVRVKEQKEKWREIYNGLGPEVSREYDSLANSSNKKHISPNYKSQGQPSGWRDKTNMAKVNYVMEVTDASNTSREGHWTEDRTISLDEEYIQDSDSDEEYDGILKPAFHVDGEPNFESGPPEDGMEYLRRVRWEASKIPKVKVAKLDRSKVSNNQSEYMPKIPDIAKCPDRLLPSREWEELFLAEFEKLRMALSSSQPPRISSSDASSGNPTLSAILGMEPVTRVSMLRRRISSFNNSNTLSHDNSVWLFALCASVDTPLDADTCASLRCLLRKCASLRAEKTETDEEVVMLNILATISGKYFKQLDNENISSFSFQF